ncbi:hypothetical protein TRIUR3_32170 [Triticum urartu]|uniref:Uncharacterized protein n=1 Tax=Triticum urartu TaxID=4572 RepID=M7ZX02_TRIUA|nr:hypothetical protein TRIUR3_32170 [Triticum urartu]
MSAPSSFTILLPVPFLLALFLLCKNKRTTTGAKSISSTRLRCGVGAPCCCSLPAKTVSVEFHQVHHRQDHTDARTSTERNAKTYESDIVDQRVPRRPLFAKYTFGFVKFDYPARPGAPSTSTAFFGILRTRSTSSPDA